jgi:hypothetical protein
MVQVLLASGGVAFIGCLLFMSCEIASRKILETQPYVFHRSPSALPLMGSSVCSIFSGRPLMPNMQKALLLQEVMLDLAFRLIGVFMTVYCFAWESEKYSKARTVYIDGTLVKEVVRRIPRVQ